MPTGVGAYPLLSTDSLDDAVELVRDHPFISRGGTLRVGEAITPPPAAWAATWLRQTGLRAR